MKPLVFAIKSVMTVVFMAILLVVAIITCVVLLVTPSGEKEQ